MTFEAPDGVTVTRFEAGVETGDEIGALVLIGATDGAAGAGTTTGGGVVEFRLTVTAEVLGAVGVNDADIPPTLCPMLSVVSTTNDFELSKSAARPTPTVLKKDPTAL